MRWWFWWIKMLNLRIVLYRIESDCKTRSPSCDSHVYAVISQALGHQNVNCRATLELPQCHTLSRFCFWSDVEIYEPLQVTPIHRQRHAVYNTAVKVRLISSELARLVCSWPTYCRQCILRYKETTRIQKDLFYRYVIQITPTTVR